MAPWDKITFAICRILAMVPCILLAANTVGIFSAIGASPLPPGIPHRNEIYLSQGLSAGTAVCGTIWLPISAVLNLMMTRKKHGYWYFLFSLFDLSIIGCLVASVALESSYLPASYGGCGDADTWQLAGNATNLFSLVQNVITFEQDDNVSPGTACNNLIDTWILSIIMIILFGLTAYCLISRILLIWPLVWVHGHTRALLKIAAASIGWSSLRPLLNIKRKKPIVDECLEMQLKSSNRKARLEDVLSYGDANHIIVSIAKNLHYSDIVSLTLTSKSIRHAVYSRLSLDKHTALLNRLACEKGSKHECWCCGIEICDLCKSSKDLPDPASKTHLDHCEPYCSTCYYKVLCRRWLSGRKKSARRDFRCECARQPAQTAIRVKYTSLLPVPSRNVCQFCAVLGQDAALGVRESREKAEMRHLTKQSLRCVVCACGISQGGPRWWGCSLCHRECGSEFHPFWDTNR